jgi:hypothetical protein
MNDRELLELAAKAAGVDFISERSTDQMLWIVGGGVWSPKHDDGDALRLAVKLDLQIHPSGDEIWVSNPAASLAEDVVFETYRDDPYAATRRAIVRAAAEIGRNMV